MRKASVERVIVSSDHEHYDMLAKYCIKSANLYNSALDELSSFYFYATSAEGVDEAEIDHCSFLLPFEYVVKLVIEKESCEGELDCYSGMPGDLEADYVINSAIRVFDSFLRATNDYCNNLGSRPKHYKYLSRKKRYILYLAGEQVELVDGVIKFPESYCGFEVEGLQLDLHDLCISQVRIFKKKDHVCVEISYSFDEVEEVAE
jgi:hypothetical protein